MLNLTKEQKISLIKEREQKITTILEKKSISNITSRVALVIDISGSMKTLYNSGVVQNVIEKIYPVARKFDDDASLDLWVFSSGYNRLFPVNQDNFDTYVEKEILEKKPSCAWSQTDYSPVMKDILKYYKLEKKSIFVRALEYILKLLGFFKLKNQIPAYIIFITDGENADKSITTKTIIESSNHPIFWQYIGIGKEKFEFLRKLDELHGRYIDNANFFQLNDISTIDDDELYKRLLNEFPSWLKEAKEKNIL